MSRPPHSINKSQTSTTAESTFFFNIRKPTATLPHISLTAISLIFLVSSTKPNTSLIKFLPLYLFPSNPRRFLRIPSMSCPSSTAFATPQALSGWLKPRVPSQSLASWGLKPGTKNVHNLWLELSQGETSLLDSSPPLRTVNVVSVRVLRKNNNLFLVEAGQELSDASFRDRFQPLSEKMKPHESIEEAVARAVREELGSMTVSIVPGSYEKKLEERNSASYPGLPARYVLHSVDAWVEGLPEGDFVTEEKEEYEDLDGSMGLEKAVSVRKHFWKWSLCEEICRLKWSNSGQQVAGGGNDIVVRIWDRSVASLNSPKTMATQLEKMAELTGQSPDGCTVASLVGDETPRLWNVFGDP
ncbi:hypothetical protein V6N13_145886 [Hibiscus sabdariffa]|uniref:Nudix hydrolase domain-containing protein n=1 Tax=Hibiscus sabdariffa TaxID=183260 RepID=A0ABR2TR02_9ROSI